MEHAVSRVPWHLWMVGAASLLWNGFGAFDYVMTQTGNADYLAQFEPEQLAYFEGFPAWAVATWALAVWGGVLGSVLLLVRSKWAAPAFLVSLVSMAANTVYTFVLSDGMEMMGAGGAAFSAVIFVIALALLLYARAMARAGVLR
jgi:hypothetical protein